MESRTLQFINFHLPLCLSTLAESFLLPWNNDYYNALSCHPEFYQRVENVDTGLEAACRAGDRTVVKWMTDHGASNWNVALRGACHGHHLSLKDEILLTVKRGIDFNYGIEGAFVLVDM